MEWTQIFIPIVVSFAITVSVMPLFIGYFQMKKQGQVTREDGPTWHSVKTGTPTICLLYTSPSPRDYNTSRMPSSA